MEKYTQPCSSYYEPSPYAKSKLQQIRTKHTHQSNQMHSSPISNLTKSFVKSSQLQQNQRNEIFHQQISCQQRVKQIETITDKIRKALEEKNIFENHKNEVKSEADKANNYKRHKHEPENVNLVSIKKNHNVREEANKRLVNLSDLSKCESFELMTSRIEQSNSSNLPHLQPFSTKESILSHSILYPNVKMTVNQEVGNCQQTQRTEVKKMIELILNQLQLDKAFREQRQMWEKCKDSSKIHQAEAEFHKYQDGMGSFQEFLSEINISCNQYNPFRSTGGCEDFSFEKLVNSYLQSKRHWHSSLLESISAKKLEKQLFTVKQIDLKKKGYIAIEDFVSYLNVHSESSLRIRDAGLFFKRLSGQADCHSLKYEFFLSAIIMSSD